MIRKKKVNDKKKQEEALQQKLQAERLQRKKEKERQLELIENLKKTYSHINPTIIQGQRINKVIEDMIKRSYVMNLLQSNLLINLKSEDFEQFSEEIQEKIKNLIKNEKRFFELKEQIQIQTKNFQAYINEDEEEDQLENEEDLGEEQKEILKQLTFLKEELEIETDKIKSNTNDLVFLFLEKEKQQNVLKDITYTKNNYQQDVSDVMDGIRYLFKKKLSTGYDEDQSHKILLQTLMTNFEQNSILLEQRESVLEDLIQNRLNTNNNKNQEIKSLRNDLFELNQQEEEKRKQLEEKSNQRIEEKQQNFENKKQKLQDLTKQIKEKLMNMEKLNMDKQIIQQKKNEDIRKRLQNLISEYDTSIEKKQQEIEQIDKDHNKILQDIKKYEDKCYYIKLELKMNKDKQEIWDADLKSFQIENEVKKNSANLIFNTWKLWKLKSKKKKKKKKKKNK